MTTWRRRGAWGLCAAMGASGAFACGSGADSAPYANTDGSAGSAAADSGSGGSSIGGSGGSGGGSSATGGAAGSAGSAATGGDAGADAPSGCTSNTDCAAAPGGPTCDLATGDCVGCVGAADCPTAQYCDLADQTCKAGCDEASDCTAPTDQCDPQTNTCKECLLDTDCSSGQICVSGVCATGCSAAQPCAGSNETCCNASCHDTTSDVNNCGSCGNACPAVQNAATACNAGQCGMGACAPGFANCNQLAADGCEHNSAQSGPCGCVPGQVEACYQGPAGTQNVGACKAGTRTCLPSGLAYGPCLNQVLPVEESCTPNGIDDDCDGQIDVIVDIDGDGWNKCQGDCCETSIDCSNPELVNPGAYDVPGNNVDDDCDGTIDNPPASCDGPLASNASNPIHYAHAIDICQTTTENPPIATKKWGVISGAFHRANGASTPQAVQRSIRTGFGSGVSPLLGSKLAVLSTGHAAAQTSPNNTSPAYAAFQGGQNLSTTSTVPADWLAANGNTFPNAPGCPGPNNGTTAYDPIMLKLRIRVPTNARSFNLSSFFYSSEYPEWVCSPFNDFFLVLLDSTFTPGPGETANPADKNLAFYDPPPVGPPFYPVGVNLAHGNTGLFQVCLNGPTGCGQSSVPGNTNTCTGINQLLGTGFDIVNPPSQFANEPGWCGVSNRAGGGTGWLTVRGNVTPGETIEIRFVTWDTGDPWYDSLVLLDRFQWQLNASQPGTGPG